MGNAEYGLSAEDVRKLKEIKTWYDRNKGLFGNLYRRNPRLFGEGGGGSSAAMRAIIIEAPSEPDYDSDPQSEAYQGRSWFTCRLVGTTPTKWEALDPQADPPEVFAEGTTVAYPEVNSPTYIALEEISDPAEIVTPPPSLPSKWEKCEEVRVKWAEGFENIVNTESPPVNIFDIRNCFPLPKAGEIVTVNSRVVGEETRYYITSPSLQYGGLPIESSIRTGVGGFARAVYM